MRTGLRPRSVFGWMRTLPTGVLTEHPMQCKSHPAGQSRPQVRLPVLRSNSHEPPLSHLARPAHLRSRHRGSRRPVRRALRHQPRSILDTGRRSFRAVRHDCRRSHGARSAGPHRSRGMRLRMRVRPRAVRPQGRRGPWGRRWEHLLACCRSSGSPTGVVLRGGRWDGRSVHGHLRCLPMSTATAGACCTGARTEVRPVPRRNRRTGMAHPIRTGLLECR